MNTCLTADGACNVRVAKVKKVLSHYLLPFQASLQSVLLIADAVRGECNRSSKCSAGLHWRKLFLVKVAFQFAFAHSVECGAVDSSALSV